MLDGRRASVIFPVADQPYGERGGRLADPFGHLWMIASPHRGPHRRRRSRPAPTPRTALSRTRTAGRAVDCGGGAAAAVRDRGAGPRRGPVRPRPSVVVPETETGPPAAAESTRCASARRVPIRGALPITWTAALPSVQPAPGEQPAHLGQQRDPAGARPLRTAGAEHRADVAEAGRGQQRVAQRVRGDVAVGVPGAAVDAGPEQPGHPALAARLDRVHVGADARPSSFLRQDRRRSGRRRARQQQLGDRRSHAVVIGKASGSPGTVCTGSPTASTSPASSVVASVRPS